MPNQVQNATQNALDQRMLDMQAEMREMRSAIVKVAEAMSKLSVLEERNLTASVAIEKIANKIDTNEAKFIAKVDRNEEKIVHLELEHAKFESKISGIAGTMKVMWAAFGGGVIYIGGEAIKQFFPH